jgi:DNA (cytosine-5)-methyltransferase 1
MNALDLFSGVGGNAFAFRSFAKPSLYCEIDATAVTILRSAMARGQVATAPVHDDVTTLIGSPAYEAAKLERPLMVSGSWPCQGNSAMGKGKGMDDPRSGLLRALCAVILDARPDVFFAENVPAVLRNGSFDYLQTTLGELYDIQSTVVRAADLGFPHVRARFFCVGTLRGGVPPPRVAEPIARLLLGPKEPARTIPCRAANWADQVHALGNAVVPASSFYAFAMLTGQPVGGLPDSYEPRKLVFDPDAYTPPAGRVPNKNQRRNAITKPLHTTRWSTPRAGMMHACHTLSERTIRDLGTQVRFERSTPDGERTWLLNPAWLCWLMGFPLDYTEVPGQAVIHGVSGAFRSRQGDARRGRRATAPMPKGFKPSQRLIAEQNI